MIRRVRLVNFKRFAELELALSPLTILTGLNSAGKSSVLQALLLSRLAATRSQSIPLNGPYGLELGQAGDVLHRDAKTQSIQLEIDALQSRWRLRMSTENAQATYVPAPQTAGRVPRELLASDASFIYLGAERIGPRVGHTLEGTPPDEAGLGHRGEYVADFLASSERRTVAVHLVHRSAEDVVTFRRQAELWLSDIVGRVQVDANVYPEVMTAGLRFREHSTSDWIRSPNVGFGISYCLPVVVAALMVPVGGTLIVENPEAHLHPAGQSALGRLLARVAGGGSQVIVETHSDHFLNGARLGVADEGSLSPADLVVHFFGADGVEALRVDGSGRMNDWPAGFFDQAARDLARLTRIAIQ